MNTDEDDTIDELLQTIINHVHNNPISRTPTIWEQQVIMPSPGHELSTPLSISIPRINIPSPRFLSTSMFDPRTLAFGDELESDNDSTAVAPSDSSTSIIHDTNTTQTQTEIDTCCVCYNETSFSNVVNTPCNHNVCSTCFFRWIKTNPSCPMCRLDFTSWDRLSFEEINTELSNINVLFRSVVREHNHLLLRKKDLEKKVSFIKKELKEVTLAASSRRNFTDFIRGYNHAIMIGNNEEVMKWNDDKASYKKGYLSGKRERNYFLNAMGISKKDFLNYDPTEILYKRVIKNKPVRIIRRRRNNKKEMDEQGTSFRALFQSELSNSEEEEEEERNYVAVGQNGEVSEETQESANST